MTETAPVRVFDGHNDALLRLYNGNRATAVQAFLNGETAGHIDLPRARAGGLAGGMFAIFPPPLPRAAPGTEMRGVAYDIALPPELDSVPAQKSTLGMAAILVRLERDSGGAFTVCRTAAEVTSAMDRGSMAAVFHIEGAEAIDTNLDLLDVLHAAGLRSLGLVWSRSNAFGHGVPFRFPSSPDIGPGLTDAGKALVRACNELKIVVDMSHLNERGFRDVAAISDAPLVCTHSNAHSVSPHSRNLTPWQLSAIKESGGVAGLNFAVSFLRPDGQMNGDTGLDVMLRHLDAMLEALGEEGVALGSDFDGARIPDVIGDATGLPRLVAAMQQHGFGDALIERIAWRNWISLLERTIG